MKNKIKELRESFLKKVKNRTAMPSCKATSRCLSKENENTDLRELPGGPIVRTLNIYCHRPMFGRGTKIPQALQCNQKKKGK